jgi:hypothetical protein
MSDIAVQVCQLSVVSCRRQIRYPVLAILQAEDNRLERVGGGLVVSTHAIAPR